MKRSMLHAFPDRHNLANSPRRGKLNGISGLQKMLEAYLYITLCNQKASNPKFRQSRYRSYRRITRTTIPGRISFMSSQRLPLVGKI
jgi:hypothetical protein